MRKITMFITLLLMAVITNAQLKQVTGTVVSKSTGKPLPGITVQSGKLVTATDAAGVYSIQVNKGDKILFSSAGMKSFSLTVGDQDSFSVILEEDQQSLGEVVVVGYTSQRKKDLTGAVAVVDLSAVKNNSSGNTMQALQGRVAGLYIEKDGSPNGSNGRILIRGANTLGNNDPLYIIDGVATTRPEVFQNMDPSNIASVQVLKDASAASIYGARASNGVIIVTTKNGGKHKWQS